MSEKHCVSILKGITRLTLARHDHQFSVLPIWDWATIRLPIAKRGKWKP